MTQQESTLIHVLEGTSEAGANEPMYLHLSVVDPEAIAALAEAKEGRDR